MTDIILLVQPAPAGIREIAVRRGSTTPLINPCRDHRYLCVLYSILILAAIPTKLFPAPALLCYIIRMFTIIQHAEGERGSFIKLVQLEGDDFVVVIRDPNDGRLKHRYVGPDQVKAEESFASESRKLGLS